MAEIDKMLETVMQRRTASGLRLTWYIPAEKREFTAYPKSDEQKYRWLARAVLDGWELLKG